MIRVLGIDTAWTERHSSGVALVEQHSDGWRCVRVAPSYEAFLTRDSVDWRHDVLSPAGFDRIKAIGGSGCGTHSPTRERPGRISETLRADLESEGHELATTATRAGTTGQILEVFPHTGILDLLSEEYRVPCKVKKTKRYWPDKSVQERRKLLLENQHRILDALVCAWTGIRYLEGRATAYGDVTAAIWVPTQESETQP